MKIKTTKTTTEEIEVELPAFHRNGYAYLKTTDEDRYILVKLYGFDTSVEVYSMGNLLNADWTPITEFQFNEAYDKALRILFTNRPLKKINLEKSFNDLKQKIATEYMEGIPTNGRYEYLISRK